MLMASKTGAAVVLVPGFFLPGDGAAMAWQSFFVLNPKRFLLWLQAFPRRQDSTLKNLFLMFQRFQEEQGWENYQPFCETRSPGSEFVVRALISFLLG